MCLLQASNSLSELSETQWKTHNFKKCDDLHQEAKCNCEGIVCFWM